MAITVDQFLRDLTERRLLSGEDARTFRRQLAENAQGQSREESGLAGESRSATQTAAEASPLPLILCDCLIHEKLHEEKDRLIFAARRLQDDSPVWMHILGPARLPNSHPTQIAAEIRPTNGLAVRGGPSGIVQVGRHGEMICVCCESLEADTLADVVSQNGPLPLELAGECLLETVQSLKRFSDAGLTPERISADELYLDENGNIHLSGRDPSWIVTADPCGCEDEPPALERTCESLGKLYHFLQTGRTWDSAAGSEDASAPADDPSSPEATGTMPQSANVIKDRMLRTAGVPGYETWDALIGDLKKLVSGEAVAPPAASRPREPALPSNRPAPALSKPSAAKTGRWIALAVFLAAAIAAFAVFNH